MLEYSKYLKGIQTFRRFFTWHLGYVLTSKSSRRCVANRSWVEDVEWLEKCLSKIPVGRWLVEVGSLCSHQRPEKRGWYLFGNQPTKFHVNFFLKKSSANSPDQRKHQTQQKENMKTSKPLPRMVFFFTSGWNQTCVLNVKGCELNL